MTVEGFAQAKSNNFIRNIIAEDLKNNKHEGMVATRFPPEPNGYLHIGHAKSICLNFGLAMEDEKWTCNLRFDDTNPVKEDTEYVDAIKKDIKWLGFDWGEKVYFASGYFDKLYDYAIDLIKRNMAFVCSLSPQQIKEYRGTLKEPGKESPDRNRSVAENLDLFEKMKNGQVDDGQYVLRVKIDMAHPNLNMRDPVIYRVRKVTHHKTQDKWSIYPMYDYTHCLCDAEEHITHSLCSLEFEDHRPLYDWFINKLTTPSSPRQIEFARLNIDYTVMSKRKLLQLVQEGHVGGWDDPRMPTILGMRRRGYTPESIRNFTEVIGVTKKNTCISFSTLESCIRDDLDKVASRAMAVLDPVKVVIDSYPSDKVEILSGPRHPKNESFGRREIPISNEIYIERDDFMENPPKKYFRLSPGGEVRLRYGYVIKCNEVIKDGEGKVIQLNCSHYPETLGGKPLSDGRKVKGIVHWVCAKSALEAEVRIYDRLFKDENPEKAEGEKTFLDNINSDSLKVINKVYVEPSLNGVAPEKHFQFERIGYFCTDMKDSTDSKLVFNRTVTLKDTWAKLDSKK